MRPFSVIEPVMFYTVIAEVVMFLYRHCELTQSPLRHCEPAEQAWQSLGEIATSLLLLAMTVCLFLVLPIL